MDLRKKVSSLLLLFLCTIWFSLPAFAAELTGNIDRIDPNGISGWALNKQSVKETITVELHIYAEGSDTSVKTLSVEANNYSEQLSQDQGDGFHYFTIPVDWSAYDGMVYTVKAYAVSGEERHQLPGISQYSKYGDGEVGPGIPRKEVLPEVENTSSSLKRGDSLGTFTTTAYCSCSKCSSGHNLTYSGTVPKEKHTISADLDVFPLGTKLIIGDTVYTVEDIGSGIDGRKLDIFFSSHSDALNYGRQSVEVFTVE